MKKLLCTLLIFILFIHSSALAINRERFLNEPNNTAYGPSIMYGLQDMMKMAAGNPGGLMLMLYGTVGIDNTDYPVLTLMFGADKFIPTSAQIETDRADYTLLSTGNISLMGVTKVDNVANILTTSDMAEVYRAISESKKVKITFIGKGRKYNFKLTDAQKHQLALVVQEFDEEIAKYLDPANPEYSPKLANMYSLGGPTVGVTKKHADTPEEPASAPGEYKTLKPGSKGQAVLDARMKLYELGYFNKKPTQKEYTNNMKDYVKKFEKDNGLKQDGILSPEDQEVLFGL